MLTILFSNAFDGSSVCVTNQTAQMQTVTLLEVFWNCYPAPSYMLHLWQNVRSAGWEVVIDPVGLSWMKLSLQNAGLTALIRFN